MTFEHKVNQLDRNVFQTLNYILELFRNGGFLKEDIILVLERLPLYLTCHRVKLLKTHALVNNPNITPPKLFSEKFAAQLSSAVRNTKITMQKKTSPNANLDIKNPMMSSAHDDSKTPEILSPKSDTNNSPPGQEAEIISPIENNEDIAKTGNRIDLLAGHSEARVPVKNCKDFLSMILMSYVCTKNTSAMFKETLLAVHEPPDSLHASKFVENLNGFGTIENLADILKIGHPTTIAFEETDPNPNMLEVVTENVNYITMSVNSKMQTNKGLDFLNGSNESFSKVSKQITIAGASAQLAGSNFIKSLFAPKNEFTTAPMKGGNTEQEK
jgi:hypothetical protein